MNPNNSDLEAAEKYAESCDNESGGFLTHQLEAIRAKAFLKGLAHRDANPSERELKLVEALRRLAKGPPSTMAEPTSVWYHEHLNKALKAYDGAKNG